MYNILHYLNSNLNKVQKTRKKFRKCAYKILTHKTSSVKNLFVLISHCTGNHELEFISPTSTKSCHPDN